MPKILFNLSPTLNSLLTMKWFFLLFLILFAVVVNSAILDKISIVRVLATGIFNLFIVSLLGIWWSAYFKQNDMDYPHLGGYLYLLLVAAGLALILTGVDAILNDSCDILISDRHRVGNSRRFIQSIMHSIESIGYCREMGFIVTGVGVLTALINSKIFIRLQRKS